MRTRIGQLLARCGGARPRGFTLIEMLVAVGAVALVGVAIATVFEAVGKTVGTGKRMATLNSYANLIQQQMERDFSSMTRTGFLVIRNEMADADGDGVYDVPNPGGGRGSDAIPLEPDDLSPRPRRIDELMFFVKGDFTTAREALDPRFIARADAASIYYGMGKRRRSDSSPTGEYLRPTLNHPNDQDTNAWLGQQAAGNPNRYASDWTLLRLVRLLAAERNTQNLATSAVLGQPPISTKLLDYDDQVALQPAASNLFRALNSLFPDPPSNLADRIRPAAIYAPPAFASGIVDIATTSLEQVRLVVTTADTWPGSTSIPGERAAGPAFFDPVTGNAGDPNDFPDGGNAGVDGKSRRAAFAAGTGVDQWLVAREQAWMIDALPAWSNACDDPTNLNTTGRARMRYEPEPPNYLDVLANQTGITLSELRADQLMLSSSNFVPRCTEFIVEWSYGRTWPSETTSPNYWAEHEGELIWHGMERLADGSPPPQTFVSEESVARPYGAYPLLGAWKAGASVQSMQYRKVDGTYGSYTLGGTAARGAELVHGQGFSPGNLAPGQPVTSFFGYNDPTFNPDADNDGMLVSPGDSAEPTTPWAWPRLVRVTIGLADPNDPSFEQRYQFVFTLPDEPAP